MFIMYLLMAVTSCIVTAVICNVVFYWRTERAEMDVQWSDNMEDDLPPGWRACLHMPTTTNYDEVKKIIVKVNKPQ